VTPPTADEIKDHALALGFVACGIATLGPSARGDALDEWLARGFAGTMRYLHRQAAKRKAPETITPGARTAVVVLENYAAPEDERPAADDLYRIAAYARGADYHDVTMARLRRLADWLTARGASVAHPWIDAGPVPERELAERAGLGWIGKNTMLIHPRIGSWTFIGTVFTDLDPEHDAASDLDLCGSCTRCLDACPTDAFVDDRVLDATRCISYLTIEAKGEPPGELVPDFRGWAFGCDICNDVCPWNIKFARPTAMVEFARRAQPDRRDPEAFERIGEEEFTERYGDTPLMRPGLAGMRRNVRAALVSVHRSEDS
jgi:epoxyqueuosine reductase